MTNFMNLTQPMSFRAARESSWDRSGGNVDSIANIQPGETRVLADLKGPGVISHIWITAVSTDVYYLRRVLLRMYWDGEENPLLKCLSGTSSGLGTAAYIPTVAPLFLVLQMFRGILAERSTAVLR